MLLTSLILLLMSNAVTTRRDKSILYSRVAIIILLYSSFLCYSGLNISFLEKGIGLYGGLFYVNSTTQIFHLFVLLLSASILSLTAFYPRKIWLENYSSFNHLIFSKFLNYKTKIINKMGEQFRIIEYPLIILFIVSGALFLMSSSDIVSIFLSIELQSYGLYLLSTIYRNSELATSGGLTYFLLGGLSSCFILLSTSLLYANSGTTSLDSLYVITSISETSLDNTNILYWYKPYYIHLSLLIMSVGFLFKVSAAPFHFWSPDVYDAIPTIVTTFVAIVAKVSIFIFFLGLVHYTSKSLFSFNYSWTTSLLLSSLLSLIVGSVLGLTQFRIKRLYAYSTISHVGFILLALSVYSIESIQAFIFYLMQYSVSNLNSFIILVTMGYSLYLYTNDDANYKDLQDKNNSPIQLISQIKGYFYINPLLALSLSISLFSFAGIPPLMGFFAKQMVFSAALDNGYVFITLVAILTSVVSAVYYLAVIKQVFFEKPDYKLNSDLNDLVLTGNIINRAGLIHKFTYNAGNIKLSGHQTITISILTLVILLFIFIPQEWLSMANILALIMFNP
uniref:NADH-ubiquinone oxidoreductase chain 2 n=1 Tax=Botryosphaeria dothidea TaxID=55169 RepID=A0A2U8XC10_9PEZI|nr:NADH dehydrogenase subunit 2 [Botryosphaeria dothidea]AWN55991.1 NADH dehydrogenase subunit 2 [Botryosphaeria dothidea]AWN56015.1 NADH dehydrogenase subunit 2 [Botryosphaeria dothidea]AWN56052.1 NADH dehydrogenase subunit 2 [Botryosphaeria dothidea]AWN56076.1 NADH dehydrogenase subunit 2 [Botryosphaeria dothidea]